LFLRLSDDWLYATLYNNSYENEIFRSVSRRVYTVLNLERGLAEGRIEFWSALYDSSRNFWIGCGLGCSHARDDSGNILLGLGADSGFLKRYVEFGVIGSFMFYGGYLFILRDWYRQLSQDGQRYVFVFAALLLAFETTYEFTQTSWGGFGIPVFCYFLSQQFPKSTQFHTRFSRSLS
jgi:O-antigen ligase